MAISPAPLILGGVALLALLASAGEGKEDRPPLPNGDRDPVGPIPVPTTDEDLLLIDQTICDCWEALGKPDNLASLRACLGETLHPDVPWPAIASDDNTVKAVWELFTLRTQAFLASPDKASWCAGLDPFDPLDVLQEWVVEEAAPGKFYVVGTDPDKTGDDSLSGLVRRALNRALPGAGNNSGNRVDYMRCITSGPNWNWRHYASNSFSESFPEWAGVNGMGLRRAFYPWHEDAKVAIANRRMPKRAITQAGARIPGVGNSYAMLWLPPVDVAMLDQQGIVTCGSNEWSDGSSSIDPPPEILNFLMGGN
jgi:hypothetical protein